MWLVTHLKWFHMYQHVQGNADQTTIYKIMPREIGIQGA